MSRRFLRKYLAIKHLVENNKEELLNRDIRPEFRRVELHSESESQIEKEDEDRKDIVKKSKKKNKKKKSKQNKTQQAEWSSVSDTESQFEEQKEVGGAKKKSKKKNKNSNRRKEKVPLKESCDSTSESESEKVDKATGVTAKKSTNENLRNKTQHLESTSDSSDSKSQAAKENGKIDDIAKKSKEKNKRRNSRNETQPDDDPKPGCSTDYVYKEGNQVDETSTNSRDMLKNKNKKRNQKRNSVAMDEIDRCVMEVNKILGEPQLPSEPALQEVDKAQMLLSVEVKHLDMNVELTRRFGPPERDPKGKKPPRNRPFKKLLIGIIQDHRYCFTKSGLSMEMLDSNNGLKEFKFVHDTVYQKRFREYFNDHVEMPYLYATKNYREKYTQVEILLDCASRHFLEEDYTNGCYNIEHVVAFMQCMAHPHFILTDPNVRLDYKYLENRAFHIALLQYLYTVMNKSCHRTALEIAKVMLRLDPTDPLAVIPISFDTLALNAAEYEWFIDIIDYWNEQNNTKQLSNVKFSYALAHFHVASKNKGDTSHADELLQEAMLEFPYMTRVLLENINTFPKKKLPTHLVFNAYANKFTHVKFKELMLVHAKLSSRNWKDRRVLAWLEQQLDKVLEKLNMEEYVAEQPLSPAVKCWPVSVNRHLSILKEMSEFVTEGAIPPYLLRNVVNPDPPLDGVDPYNCYPKPEEQSQMRLQRFISNNQYMLRMGY